jgi:hypothetical protein
MISSRLISNTASNFPQNPIHVNAIREKEVETKPRLVFPTDDRDLQPSGKEFEQSSWYNWGFTP